VQLVGKLTTLTCVCAIAMYKVDVWNRQCRPGTQCVWQQQRAAADLYDCSREW